tara:strand:+ start:280 stop:441 length:162 start_codon:yes stop_codon:yes gene_type:complete
MKIGNLVRYNTGESSVTGKIKSLHGKSWVTVEWSDRVVLKEHKDDLVLRETKK